MLKKALVCLILAVCLIFTGCDIFTGVSGGSSGGSGGSSGGGSSGGGGGSGGGSVIPPYIPPDTSTGTPGIDGHTDLSDYLYGFRIVSKKDSSSYTTNDKMAVENSLYVEAGDILSRLLAEYGPMQGLSLPDAGGGNSTTTIVPFAPITDAQYFTNLGLSPSSCSNLTYAQIAQYAADLAGSTQASITGGAAGPIFFATENNPVDVDSSFMLTNNYGSPINVADLNSSIVSYVGVGDTVGLSSYLINGSSGAFYITDSSNNYVAFLAVGVGPFNYNLVTNTHANAIALQGWAWNLITDTNDQITLAADIAKLIVFGDGDVPSAISSLAPAECITACAPYIDHAGLTAAECDLVSQFILNNVIGTGIVNADNSNFSNQIGTSGDGKTFDSNEYAYNGAAGQYLYRNLIADFNNTDARYNGYNSIFNTITYNTDISGGIDGTKDMASYPSGYKDTGNPGFKNYINTVYASVYYAASLTPVAGILQYIDATEDYITGSLSYDAEEVPGADDGGWPVTDDDQLSNYTDYDLTGAIQTVIIMPKQAIALTYIDLVMAPDYKYFNPGDTLTVMPLMRYYDGEHMYQTWLPTQTLQMLEDDGYVNGMSPDIAEVEFDVTTAIFKDSSGNVINNFIMSLDSFTSDPNFVNNIRDAQGGGLGLTDAYSINDSGVIISDYTVNNMPGIDMSSITNSQLLNTNFAYGNPNGMKYAEISFVVLLNGLPYNNPYAFGVMPAGLYGDI